MILVSLTACFRKRTFDMVFTNHQIVRLYIIEISYKRSPLAFIVVAQNTADQRLTLSGSSASPPNDIAMSLWVSIRDIPLSIDIESQKPPQLCNICQSGTPPLTRYIHGTYTEILTLILHVLLLFYVAIPSAIPMFVVVHMLQNVYQEDIETITLCFLNHLAWN